MGFRNMQAFNKALLPKQAWRVLTQEESLIAKVLKGKYFPTKSFMEATAAPNASYTWRPILSAREVLSKGVRRMVGDGSTIRIWEDPWVPNLPHFRVSRTETRHEEQPQLVKDLISNNTWNEEVLRANFSPWEVDEILKIPISMYCMRDSWSSDESKDGEYSVRSAYYLTLRDDRVRRASTSHSHATFEWQNLWSSLVAPKIKHLAWCAIHGGLPVKTQLAYRGMDIDVKCPFCGEEEETITHLFLASQM